jgi:hypothetical protein
MRITEKSIWNEFSRSPIGAKHKDVVYKSDKKIVFRDAL